MSSSLTKTFFFVSLVLLSVSCKVTTIHSINIVKEANISWESKEPCIVQYSGRKSSVDIPGMIKCRGGFSSKYLKHSYSLELNSKIRIGSLRKDDDFILNANYIDKTFMRHKICFDLFREMNPQKNLAAECAYANLSINGDFKGLYVVMEEINASLLKLDKSDTLAMLFKDPPVFEIGRLPVPQDSLNYYQQKYPKLNISDKTYYIEQFRDFLFNSGDTEFAHHIEEWVDIENVLDWHLMLLLSNNSDGIMKNFYLYKVDSKTPFRFAIWDYDHCFGRDGDNELNMMERELDCNRSVLLRRLMEIVETNYCERLKMRYLELRKRNIISTEHFSLMINRNDRIISKEVSKNSARWPVDDKWYYDDNEYSQELGVMLSYIKMRIARLDETFSKSFMNATEAVNFQAPPSTL